MTNAVGLHFGHDAGVAVIDPDGLKSFSSKERISRVKHAMGLSLRDIEPVFQDCAVVGLSSTQEVPIPLHPEVSFTLEEAKLIRYADWVNTAWPHYQKYLSWSRNHPETGLLIAEGVFQVAVPNKSDSRPVVEQLELLRKSLVRRGQVEYSNRSIPAYFFSHHLLHAEYAIFAMGDRDGTLVVSSDGWWGPTFEGGGIFYYGPSLEKVVPLSTLDGWIGQFYQSVGRALGLGEDGSGKLMGLAPYGRPIYVDGRLVGTRSEVLKNFGLSLSGGCDPINSVVDHWLREIAGTAHIAWDKTVTIPPDLVSDVAASAQLAVELNQLMASRRGLAAARGLGLPVKKLLVAGGVGLNSPSNSNLATALDVDVDCPPAINDEGLCIGAAVAAFSELTGAYPARPRSIAATVFLGYKPSADLLFTAARENGYRLLHAGLPAVECGARLIREGEILALFSGRSEIGPRALGHRSLLADPTAQRQWYKVNNLKGREAWRPLAPAVLETDWPIFFDRVPKPSRYMLFNYRVKTRDLPAVTHFDSTARAQVVDVENEILYRLLVEFKALTGIPVLINTSFNGPGRPIVETEMDAFEEARLLRINYVLTDEGLFGLQTESKMAPL